MSETQNQPRRNNPQDAPRKPREWTEEEVLTAGNVQIIIKTSPAGKRGGKLYSFDPSRVEGDRTSRFYRPGDLRDLENLAVQARHWHEADKHEVESSMVGDKRQRN